MSRNSLSPDLLLLLLALCNSESKWRWRWRILFAWERQAEGASKRRVVGDSVAAGFPEDLVDGRFAVPVSWRRSALKVCLGSCVLKSLPGSPPASTPQSGHCFSRFPFPPQGSFPLPIKSFYNWSSFSRWAGIVCTNSQWALEKYASSTFFFEVLWKLSSASLSHSCIPLRHFAFQLSGSFVQWWPAFLEFLASSSLQKTSVDVQCLPLSSSACEVSGRKELPRKQCWVWRGEVSVIFHQTHEPQIIPFPQRLLQAGALASWACVSCFLPFCLWVTWKLFSKLYSTSPTWEWVPFQEGICKSNLFTSSTKLAQVPS